MSPRGSDFARVFGGSRVLVTGHTGFKGAWLALWLEALGARVTGLGLDPSTEPSLSSTTMSDGNLSDVRHDIRDVDFLTDLFREVRPDFVFHLAAQAIVKRSFAEPRETFETNVLGTINVLESLRILDHPSVAVMITSDKAYLNKEWVWGYRETDQLGGHDPYSGSKAAAELALASYVDSFFPPGSPTRIGIARAGNVIGGGDWSPDRIVPDAIRAWRADEPLGIRSSLATRPWQHVLEPLSGYLSLAARLSTDGDLAGEAFNFGPGRAEGRTVAQLVKALQSHLPGLGSSIVPGSASQREAGLLQLNCDKASSLLDWRSILTFDETVDLTCDWYERFYSDPSGARKISLDQIARYSSLRTERG